MAVALGWASFKVIKLARKSLAMHKNPAYILYSDPACLNKWGFLYVQYRATSYFFVVPFLAYILAKAVFIAFAQGSPIVQAIGLVVVEAVAFVGVCVYRPFMDKKTNALNISIMFFNFLNSIFLLVFSNVFGQPEMVNGVMGVLFVLFNVVFAIILLTLVLISSIYAVVSKNPETRYQPMRDDRGSFIKSQQQLTTELDALGATARGANDGKNPYGYETKKMDDDVSMSSGSLDKPTPDGRPISSNQYPQDNAQLYPSESIGRRGPQNYAQQQMYNQGYNGSDYSYNRPSTSPQSFPNNSNNYPRTASAGGYGPQQGYPSRNQNSSPWQRGAGYE